MKRLTVPLLASTVGITYWLTLLPGTGHHGDTAKFQFIGEVLGTPHHTATPSTWCSTPCSCAWSRLDRSLYGRNLLSAVFATAAVVALYAFLRELDIRRVTASAGVAIFAFTPTFWSQSVVAEVYTLHVLLMAIIATSLARWRSSRRRLYMIVAIGFFALSLGNHMMTVLLAPGVILFGWITRREDMFNLRTGVTTAVALALGVGQYAYIIVRSMSAPPGTYMESRVTDLAFLWDVMSGSQFASSLFAFPLGNVLTERLPFIPTGRSSSPTSSRRRACAR